MFSFISTFSFLYISLICRERERESRECGELKPKKYQRGPCSLSETLFWLPASYGANLLLNSNGDFFYCRQRLHLVTLNSLHTRLILYIAWGHTRSPNILLFWWKPDPQISGHFPCTHAKLWDVKYQCYPAFLLSFIMP